MPELTEEQLKGMLIELDEGSFMILKQDDLAFVQGAKLNVEMGFPLAPGDVQRIVKIYGEFKKVQHSSMKMG